MSTILEQEIKQETKEPKTFEELCPQWSRKVHKGDLTKTADLNLGECRMCVVGEAYGFDNECYTHSMVIYNTRADRQNIEGFINHFNEVHTK